METENIWTGSILENSFLVYKLTIWTPDWTTVWWVTYAPKFKKKRIGCSNFWNSQDENLSKNVLFSP